MEFVTRIKTDLNGALQMTKNLDGIMMTGDNAANKFIVELYSSAEPVILSQGTTIVGYFTRSDGETFEVNGNVEDGNACVVTPSEVYDFPGILTIAIRILEDPIYDEETGEIKDWNKKIVIASLSCDVKPTDTDLHLDAQGNPI